MSAAASSSPPTFTPKNGHDIKKVSTASAEVFMRVLDGDFSPPPAAGPTVQDVANCLLMHFYAAWYGCDGSSSCSSDDDDDDDCDSESSEVFNARMETWIKEFDRAVVWLFRYYPVRRLMDDLAMPLVEILVGLPLACALSVVRAHLLGTTHCVCGDPECISRAAIAAPTRLGMLDSVCYALGNQDALDSDGNTLVRAMVSELHIRRHMLLLGMLVEVNADMVGLLLDAGVSLAEDPDCIMNELARKSANPDAAPNARSATTPIARSATTPNARSEVTVKFWRSNVAASARMVRANIFDQITDKEEASAACEDWNAAVGALERTLRARGHITAAEPEFARIYTSTRAPCSSAAPSSPTAAAAAALRHEPTEPGDEAALDDASIIKCMNRKPITSNS